MEINELIIKPSKFHSRMAKFAHIPRYIYGVDRIVDMRGMILKHRMSAYDDPIYEAMARAAINTQAGSPDLIMWREKIEQHTREDIEEYLPILFNQALVMICTVFDVFLIDSLEVITRKQPNVLHSLTSQNDISITEVINAPDYKTIFDTIRKRALKRFDYGGIEDKIRILKKIDLDIDGAFNFKFHNDAPRNKFPQSYDKLISAYNDRHGIVHRDDLPIKTPEHLEFIADLFSYLIMSFGWVMGERFDIQTDFDLPKLVREMKEQPPPKT